MRNKNARVMYTYACFKVVRFIFSVDINVTVSRYQHCDNAEYIMPLRLDALI